LRHSPLSSEREGKEGTPEVSHVTQRGEKKNVRVTVRGEACLSAEKPEKKQRNTTSSGSTGMAGATEGRGKGGIR